MFLNQKCQKRWILNQKKKMIDNNFSNALVDVDNIVNLIDFLSSKKSKSINGQIIRIDEGMTF